MYKDVCLLIASPNAGVSIFCNICQIDKRKTVLCWVFLCISLMDGKSESFHIY